MDTVDTLYKPWHSRNDILIERYYPYNHDIPPYNPL